MPQDLPDLLIDAAGLPLEDAPRYGFPRDHKDIEALARAYQEWFAVAAPNPRERGTHTVYLPASRDVMSGLCLQDISAIERLAGRIKSLAVVADRVSVPDYLAYVLFRSLFLWEVAPYKQCLPHLLGMMGELAPLVRSGAVVFNPADEGLLLVGDDVFGRLSKFAVHDGDAPHGFVDLDGVLESSFKEVQDRLLGENRVLERPAPIQSVSRPAGGNSPSYELFLIGYFRSGLTDLEAYLRRKKLVMEDHAKTAVKNDWLRYMTLDATIDQVHPGYLPTLHESDAQRAIENWMSYRSYMGGHFRKKEAKSLKLDLLATNRWLDGSRLSVADVGSIRQNESFSKRFREAYAAVADSFEIEELLANKDEAVEDLDDRLHRLKEEIENARKSGGFIAGALRGAGTAFSAGILTSFGKWGGATLLSEPISATAVVAAGGVAFAGTAVWKGLREVVRAVEEEGQKSLELKVISAVEGTA